MITAMLGIVRQTLAARGGVWGALQTGVAQLGMTALNVVTGVLAAHALGPTGRGEFAAVMMWFLIPSLLATAGLQSGLIVLAQRDRACRMSLFLLGLSVGTTVFLPIALASDMLLPLLMSGYSTAAIRLARLAILASWLNVGLTVARQSLLGSRHTNLFNLSMLAGCASNLVAMLVLTLHAALSVEAAFAAQVATTAFVFTATSAAFFAINPHRPRRLSDVASRLMRYSIRAAPIDLSAAFYWNVDRLVLIVVVSPAQLGFYAVGTSFARLIGLIQSAVSSVALADMAALSATERAAYLGRAMRILLGCLLPACVVGWISGPILLPMVYGRDYDQAVGISQLLLVEAAASCLSQLMIESLLASGRASYATLVQVAFCLMLLGALLALAPPFGGTGAAAAMLIASIGKLALLLGGLERRDAGGPPPMSYLRAMFRRWLPRREALGQLRGPRHE